MPPSVVASPRFSSRWSRRAGALLLSIALFSAACSDDDGSADATTTSTTEATTTTVAVDEDQVSRITSFEVAESADAGEHGGQAYVRVTGEVRGVVTADEPIEGLDAVVDVDGTYEYTATFELVRPEGGAETVVVEPQNRGLGLLPILIGDQFLYEGGRAYANIAWQTEINASVPAEAQGVGQAIVRDFGRALRRGEVAGQESPLGSHEHVLLAGWSQGAWFATTLVAEGFNVDPVDGAGVFDGVLGISAAGNVLAINHAAGDGAPQAPYIRPDARPLRAEQILTRPESDPVFVDVANYTDFYRLRSGLTAGGDVDGYWRYDWPSPHAPGAVAPPSIVFERFACNGGRPVPLNPSEFRPYARALLAGLELEIGAPVPEAQRPATMGLPRPAEFDVTDEMPAGTGDVNGLDGEPVPVPAVDGDLWPRGGVRFADGAAPLGRPTPVGLPPVSTESVDAVCGNFGGWEPFDQMAVTERWPTVDDHLADFDAALEQLVQDGYVLSLDRDPMRTAASDAYRSAVGG